LEQRVATALRNYGRKRVKTNTILTDGHGNKSEIDVCCGIIFTMYVECKEYHGHNVPLEDVAKFKSVLELNNLPLSRGLFVTTSDYTPRARFLGIKTMNGDEFVEYEKRSVKVRRRRKFFKYFFYLILLSSICLIYYGYWAGLIPDAYFKPVRDFEHEVRNSIWNSVNYCKGLKQRFNISRE